MKLKTDQLLAKAQDAIEAAELLFNGGKISFAAGRAYYAMFYVAEALLFERGFEFRKHSGVHAAFGKHFAKTGEMDVKYHRYLLESFESRLEAEYGVDIRLSTAAVAVMIERAKEFLAAARNYLQAGENRLDSI
jgi:uncharacterized protein (UPF0332 family)